MNCNFIAEAILNAIEKRTSTLSLLHHSLLCRRMLRDCYFLYFLNGLLFYVSVTNCCILQVLKKRQQLTPLYFFFGSHHQSVFLEMYLVIQIFGSILLGSNALSSKCLSLTHICRT